MIRCTHTPSETENRHALLEATAVSLIAYLDGMKPACSKLDTYVVETEACDSGQGCGKIVTIVFMRRWLFFTKRYSFEATLEQRTHMDMAVAAMQYQISTINSIKQLLMTRIR